MQQQAETIPSGGDGMSKKEVVLNLGVKAEDVPQLIKLSVLKNSLYVLQNLYGAKKDAAEEYATTTKDVAEKAGLLPSVVRKYVKSCYDGVAREGAKRECEQLALLFEEQWV